MTPKPIFDHKVGLPDLRTALLAAGFKDFTLYADWDGCMVVKITLPDGTQMEFETPDFLESR